MISLTRLSGTVFLLNADLIERVDSTPDTVVTLVDGTKYVVSEPLEVVLGEIVDYRARIVARAPLFETHEAHQAHQAQDEHLRGAGGPRAGGGASYLSPVRATDPSQRGRRGGTS